MTGGPAVQVRGARELRSALRRLGEDLQDFGKIHAQVGGIVVGAAGPRIRSRSGQLAASGRAGSGKTHAIVRYGGARVPYANAVHWGTGPRVGLRGPHNIAPNRFVVDAAAATEPAWSDAYFKALEDYVNQCISRCVTA